MGLKGVGTNNARMWRNLQVLKDFKDNLTQIASDVLDTQDELATQSQEDSDGEQDGPRRHSSDYNNEGADLKAEVGSPNFSILL